MRNQRSSVAGFADPCIALEITVAAIVDEWPTLFNPRARASTASLLYATTSLLRLTRDELDETFNTIETETQESKALKWRCVL